MQLSCKSFSSRSLSLSCKSIFGITASFESNLFQLKALMLHILFFHKGIVLLQFFLSPSSIVVWKPFSSNLSQTNDQRTKGKGMWNCGDTEKSKAKPEGQRNVFLKQKNHLSAAFNQTPSIKFPHWSCSSCQWSASLYNAASFCWKHLYFSHLLHKTLLTFAPSL